MPETHMEELDETQCRKLLTDHHLGRLALVDAEGPVIMPVNYVLDGEAPVFRTDPRSKLDAAAESAPVAFEADAAEEATRIGWSVVVRGALAEVTDPGHLERRRALPLYPWAPGDKTRYLRGPSGLGHRPPHPDPRRPALHLVGVTARPTRRAPRQLLVAAFALAYLAAGGVAASADAYRALRLGWSTWTASWRGWSRSWSPGSRSRP